jgi:hypothetical protein
LPWLIGLSPISRPNVVQFRPQIVTDGKAAHHLADEPIDIIELHELRHEVPHRARLRIGPHDGDLGEGVRQNGFGDGSPLGRIGVEQALGHLAANDRGELLAEVRGVHEPEAQNNRLRPHRFFFLKNEISVTRFLKDLRTTRDPGSLGAV